MVHVFAEEGWSDRTLDEVPLHFLIYVSFAASESKANSHAE